MLYFYPVTGKNNVSQYDNLSPNVCSMYTCSINRSIIQFSNCLVTYIYGKEGRGGGKGSGKVYKKKKGNASHTIQDVTVTQNEKCKAV